MDRLLRINEFSEMSVNALVARIDTFADQWEDRADLDPEQLTQLRELATVQSIGSSTRIEGSKLQDEEITALLENMTITELRSRDEQEVMGYYDTLQIILENYEHIPLTTSTIQGLHKQLLQHSDKDEHHRGKYKTLSNQVVASMPDGGQRTIFQTSSPMETPAAMEAAVEWYDRQLTEGTHAPLVVIGTFVYEFLTIHPFQDGNGRLSRLLTTLLLLQNDYEFIQYSSLEQEVEAYKSEYYKALMRAQRHRGKKEETIGSWLVFLLKAIERTTKKLERDQQYLTEEPAMLYLNRRQRSVMNYFGRKEELSIGDINRLLPDESRNTLKYDLARLTEAGLLRRFGRGRGTVYRRSSKG